MLALMRQCMAFYLRILISKWHLLHKIHTAVLQWERYTYHITIQSCLDPITMFTKIICSACHVQIYGPMLSQFYKPLVWLSKYQNRDAIWDQWLSIIPCVLVRSMLSAETCLAPVLLVLWRHLTRMWSAEHGQIMLTQEIMNFNVSVVWHPHGQATGCHLRYFSENVVTVVMTSHYDTVSGSESSNDFKEVLFKQFNHI